MPLLHGLLLLLLLMLEHATSFAPMRGSRQRAAPLVRHDIPLIPAVLGSTALIFALFNIDNKVDLTDVGLAKAKQKRRQERISRGEFNPDANANKDPYRYRIPLLDEDDDEDLEQIISGGGKKKGGGCG